MSEEIPEVVDDSIAEEVAAPYSVTYNERPAVGLTAPPPHAETQNVLAMLGKMIDKGMSPESLEKLVSLYERVSDRAAAQEFARALSEFQSVCPPIPKASTAKITSARAGSTFEYRYAELDTIAETIRPLLHAHGLSYSWDSAVNTGTIAVVCTLRHENGYTATASFSAPIDSAAAMNAQQKVAAALTYGRRQSLIQVLGLTTTDPDPDGGTGTTDEKITEEQRANLEALLDENPAWRGPFLGWLKVETVGGIAAGDYKKAMNALEAKRGAR